MADISQIAQELNTEIGLQDFKTSGAVEMKRE